MSNENYKWACAWIPARKPAVRFIVEAVNLGEAMKAARVRLERTFNIKPEEQIDIQRIGPRRKERAS